MSGPYTQSNAQPQALTLESIKRAVEAVEALGPEPLGEWMRSQGYAPEQYTLVLPVALKSEGPALWPSYVVFSPHVAGPMFILRPALSSTWGAEL